MDEFNPTRAYLPEEDDFPRFNVKDSKPLDRATRERKIGADDDVLILTRNNQRLAFSILQMSYHHVAQGELAGQPYLVAF